MIRIREERPGDWQRVFDVQTRAFGRPNEARVVAALRTSAQPNVSLVVVDEDDDVVGHIFLSPVTLEPLQAAAPLGGLAPVGVAPERQGAGIGARLVRRGLDRASRLGWRAVFLVGSPAYYSRFGFVLAAPMGFTYGDPFFDAALQVIELEPGGLAGLTGRVCFHEAFAEHECG